MRSPREADGTVWIGTSGGLSRFRRDPRRHADFLPGVVFTKLLMGKTDVSGQRNPSVNIHSNALEARFSVLNAPEANRVVFRYRLTPANSAWTETVQRHLEFAELAPGAYRLEVEARDGDGAWSGQGSAFSSFEIMTPWYRICMVYRDMRAGFLFLIEPGPQAATTAWRPRRDRERGNS